MQILALQIQIYFTFGYKHILTNLWVLICVPIILSKLNTSSAIFTYLGISVYSVHAVKQLFKHFRTTRFPLAKLFSPH